MDKVRHFVEQSWLLIVSSFCFGLLLAATNYALAPTIRQNRIDKLNRLAKGLLSEAEHFVEMEERIEIESGRVKEEITIYKAEAAGEQCVGWSFSVGGPGFQGTIYLVVGVDAGFEKLAGYRVLSSSETPGFGDKIKYDYFRGQFEGAPAAELKLISSGDARKIDSEIVVISGATISSEAVVAIMNDSVLQVKEQMRKKGLIENGR
jgi:electron transport complex protein RnfG